MAVALSREQGALLGPLTTGCSGISSSSAVLLQPFDWHRSGFWQYCMQCIRAARVVSLTTGRHWLAVEKTGCHGEIGPNWMHHP